MATLDGQQLGPYQIVNQIGSGGMATVYKAYHARLNRHVAIKVMHEAFQQDDNFLARFEREAQIVAQLEHANIVPIYDFSDLDGRPYLVMKFIEGQTLKARMMRNPPTLADIQRILPPIANALDYAHRQGILHRDIKPSNVVIDSNGVPYLTDFGLARIAQLGESTLSQDSVLGTPQYISPEQAMGKRDLTPATDLYSLGVVLYELVVGRVPFSSDTPFATIHDHIYRALPLPSEINPELTPEIDAVLDKALSKRPEDRYKTAAELVSAFLSAVEASNLHSLNPDRSQIAAKAMLQLPREDAHDHERTAPLPVSGAIESPQGQMYIAPDQPGVEGSQPNQANAADRKRKVEVAFDLGQIASMDWSGFGKRVERTIEDIGEHIEQAVEGKQPVDVMLSSDPDSIRKRVEQQFKKRNEFVIHLVVFVLINILLWVIFTFAGDIVFANDAGGDFRLNGFPWPLIVFFGWGAGLIAHGIETFYDTGRRIRQRTEAVERALINTYGDDWSRVASKKQIKTIRSQVEKPYKKVREFFQHFGVYVMINIMLWMIYIFSGTDGALPADLGQLIRLNDFPWPLIVSLGWGVGLIINAMEAMSAGRHERAVQREVDRERSRMLDREKPKREAYDVSMIDSPRVRMNADGEFTDSMIQEMEDDAPRRRRG